MVKIASPVQYESPLEGLNDVRPLQLADVGKIVLPTPVLCKNLPTVNRPAVGRLTRCTQQGALLRDNSDFADKIYTARIVIGAEEDYRSYTFPSKVNCVIATFEDIEEPIRVHWSTGWGQPFLIELSQEHWTFLPFVGRKIWFGSEDFEEGQTGVLIKGFYK